MATWQLQEAKAKLSEVIQTAHKKGPQIITQRGVGTAVLMSFSEWKKGQPPQTHSSPRELTAEEQKQSGELLKVLQSGPQFEIPQRGRMKMRKPVEF